MSYNVILYDLTAQEPREKLLVAKRGSAAECRTVMRDVAGKGWQMNRRPDIHTYGNLVLTFEKAAP